jgi:tRNA (guanosine-2'-O-)-methyltransferase
MPPGGGITLHFLDMTPEREALIRKVASRRQPTLTIILENVHDMHNIGAVMRSCDSVGICEIFILQTQQNLHFSQLVLGKKTSAGTRKWVDVHYYQDVEACFQHVRKKYDRIWSTHLSGESASLYDLDLTEPVALLFGNEQTGLTAETLAHSDGNFIIPQAGMARSLNISVACAVSLYEAYRQRNQKGFYTYNPCITEAQKNTLIKEYIRRHEDGEKGEFADLIQ